MMLSLLRHGIAVERGSSGDEDDSERSLTAKGERRLRRSAEGMLALGLTFGPKRIALENPSCG